mgnify:CR=1 FL=1
MDKELIDRINYLARKKKESGLTGEEQAEQHALRKVYLGQFRGGIEAVLDRVFIQNEDGEYEKLRKKDQE